MIAPGLHLRPQALLGRNGLRAAISVPTSYLCGKYRYALIQRDLHRMGVAPDVAAHRQCGAEVTEQMQHTREASSCERCNFIDLRRHARGWYTRVVEGMAAGKALEFERDRQSATQSED